jgi:molybdate transport system substrate-binding protein
LIGLGLWDRLKDKVVPAKDVRHALTYVETEAAEAGIVYATDAAVSEKVRVAVEIPVGLTEPVLYPALLLDHGSANATAEKLDDFLGSPKAAEIFERFGFVVLTDAEGEAK